MIVTKPHRRCRINSFYGNLRYFEKINCENSSNTRATLLKIYRLQQKICTVNDSKLQNYCFSNKTSFSEKERILTISQIRTYAIFWKVRSCSKKNYSTISNYFCTKIHLICNIVLNFLENAGSNEKILLYVKSPPPRLYYSSLDSLYIQR